MTDVERPVQRHLSTTMKTRLGQSDVLARKDYHHDSPSLSKARMVLQPAADDYEAFRSFREARMTRHSGRHPIHIIYLLALILTFIAVSLPAYAAEGWLPISQEELK